MWLPNVLPAAEAGRGGEWSRASRDAKDDGGGCDPARVPGGDGAEPGPGLPRPAQDIRNGPGAGCAHPHRPPRKWPSIGNRSKVVFSHEDQAA